MSITIQNCNMEATMSEIVKLSMQSRYKPLYLRLQTRYQWDSNSYIYVLGSAFHSLMGTLSYLTGSDKFQFASHKTANACISASRQDNMLDMRNSSVVAVQHFTGNYGKSVRRNRKWRNRKWTNPRWQPLNFRSLYLRFQTEYQQHSNGITYIYGVQHFFGTYENTMWPNSKWQNSRFISILAEIEV